jgi:hypothetical protein
MTSSVYNICCHLFKKQQVQQFFQSASLLNTLHTFTLKLKLKLRLQVKMSDSNNEQEEQKGG